MVIFKRIYDRFKYRRFFKLKDEDLLEYLLLIKKEVDKYEPQLIITSHFIYIEDYLDLYKTELNDIIYFISVYKKNSPLFILTFILLGVKNE